MTGVPKRVRPARRLCIVAVAAAVVAVTAAAPSPVLGQASSGSGHLSANGLQPLPPEGSAVDVELTSYNAVDPGDPLHEEARRAAVRAAQGRGWTVSDRSTLVLRVGVQVGPSRGSPAGRDFGAGPFIDDPALPPNIDRGGRLEVPGDPALLPESDRVPELYPQIRVPLGRRASAVRARYTLTLSLFRRGEEPIWAATIEAAGEIPDPAVLVRELTTTALRSLGSSVERDFTLSCAGEDVARGGICLE